jgi:hypothetical protein
MFVLSYGAAIWGTRDFSCINAVQHRAIRFLWILINILLMTPLMGIWVGSLRVLSNGVVFLDTGLDVMLCLNFVIILKHQFFFLLTVFLWERPFNLKGGGVCFFSKKIF